MSAIADPIMLCRCGAAMQRQPLGHWVRTCEHHGEKRYGTNVAPLPSDLAAFMQIGGKMGMHFDGMFWYG